MAESPRVPDAEGRYPEYPTDVIYLDTSGNQAGADIALSAVMMGLGIVAVVARVCARRMRKAPLLADDYLLFVALLFNLGTAIAIIASAVVPGSTGQHEPIDVTLNWPKLTDGLHAFLKANWTILLTGTIAVGLTKMSVLLMYRRIFNHYEQYRWLSVTIWSLFALSAMWTISFLFGNMFECKKFKYNWIAYGGTAEQCMFEDPMYRGQAYSDAILDALILLVPVPMVLQLHLPAVQKLAIIGMFLLGGVTLAISIYKAVLFEAMYAKLEAEDNDLTWLLTPQMTLVLVETTIGICGACLPLLKPVFDKNLPFIRFLSSKLSSLYSMTGVTSARSPNATKQSQATSQATTLGKSSPSRGGPVERIDEIDEKGETLVKEVSI